MLGSPWLTSTCLTCSFDISASVKADSLGPSRQIRKKATPLTSHKHLHSPSSQMSRCRCHSPFVTHSVMSIPSASFMIVVECWGFSRLITVTTPVDCTVKAFWPGTEISVSFLHLQRCDGKFRVTYGRAACCAVVWRCVERDLDLSSTFRLRVWRRPSGSIYLCCVLSTISQVLFGGKISR